MDPNNPKILLIEDDTLVRHVVKTALAENHYEIAEAGSGTEGLEKARTFWPDLVLLDVMIPDRDGYEVCYRLRQSSTTANVPVILLTALGNPSEKIRGLQVGADDYITKPFDPRELRTRVEVHLRRSARELSASPLTNLPGNPLIEQILSERIESREPLAVLYFDLGNFKSYNDEYGWVKGDEVIRMLAREILETVGAVGGKADFVGHVGGDDFVVISTPAHAEKIARRVITRFDAKIPSYYSEAARARGYIQVLNRQGKLFRAPITGVVIAIVTNEKRELHHPLQVAELAAQVKKSMRLTSGSRYTASRTQLSRRASLAMMATVVLILGLLVGGTGATVYAAQDSLPNTSLYPVKIMSEDARIALAFQPETKLDLLLGYANRRVYEIAALYVQGIPAPEWVARRQLEELDEALELGAEMPDSMRTQALERVETTIQRQRQTLTRVQAQVAEPTNPVLAQVQAMLEGRLRLIEAGPADAYSVRQRLLGLGKEIPPPAENYRPTMTPATQGGGPTMTPPKTRTPPEDDFASLRRPRNDDARTKTPPVDDAAKTRTPPEDDFASLRRPRNDDARTKTPPNDNAVKIKTPSNDDAASLRTPPDDDARTKTPPNDNAVKIKTPSNDDAASLRTPPEDDFASLRRPRNDDAAKIKMPSNGDAARQ